MWICEEMHKIVLPQKSSSLDISAFPTSHQCHITLGTQPWVTAKHQSWKQIFNKSNSFRLAYVCCFGTEHSSNGTIFFLLQPSPLGWHSQCKARGEKMFMKFIW